MDPVLAILCSGQGAQHPGMFDLVAACPEAQPVFAAATPLLGRDPRELVRATDSATLYSDRVGQILCCTQALAAWAALGEARPHSVVTAGYSAGELAAWGCAGMIGVDAVVRLTEERALRMDAVAPPDGGMAAVIGLGRTALDRIVTAREVFVAIVEDEDAFVIAGAGSALDAACDDAVAAGARRVVRLKVAVPSHTPWLRDASAAFRSALRAAAPCLPRPGCRVLSGVDGSILRELESGTDKLARQISSTIDWAACLETCRACNAVAALELGPGTILSRGAASWLPTQNARAVEDFRSIDGLRSWVRATLR